MEFARPALLALLVLACTGCVNDQTKRMAGACQNLAEDPGQPGVDDFIRKAEKHVATLDDDPNRLEAFLRELQDSDAMEHKAALQDCLWALKVRRS